MDVLFWFPPSVCFCLEHEVLDLTSLTQKHLVTLGPIDSVIMVIAHLYNIDEVMLPVQGGP